MIGVRGTFTFLIPVFLLSLQDMDQLSIYLNNLCNKVIHKQSGYCTTVTIQWRHAFMKWSNILTCHFTEQDLRNIYCIFGHQSVGKLFNVITRATGRPVENNTYRFFTKIKSTVNISKNTEETPNDLISLCATTRSHSIIRSNAIY